MTISPRGGSGRIDATDPTARALRSFLSSDERASIRVVPLHVPEPVVARPSGVRRVAARVLLGLARRLAADVLETASDCA